MLTYTGTLAFCAPEMLETGEYNLKVDEWSAGVVLYTMLSKLLHLYTYYYTFIILYYYSYHNNNN